MNSLAAVLRRPLAPCLAGAVPGLLLACGIAAAADLAVIRGRDLGPYTQFMKGFQDAAPGAISYEMQSDGSNSTYIGAALVRQMPRVVVAVGPRAVAVARGGAPRVRIIAGLVDNPEKFGVNPARDLWLPVQAGGEDVIRGLRLVAPRARSLAVVTSSPSGALIRQLVDAGAAHDVEVRVFPVASEADLPDQFRKAVNSSDALWYSSDPVASSQASFEFARRACRERRIPILAFSEALVRGGAVLSVCPNYEGLGRQVARLAQRMSDGAALAGLAPVEAGSVVLTLNMPAAQEIGMEIPAAAQAAVQRVMR